MKKKFTLQAELLPGLSMFRTVARLGSFTRAADYLGVSPPAVSQAVRALEAQLGARLFNRTSRRVALSEAGSRFLAQVGSSLDRIDTAVQELRAGNGRPSGLLRINLSRLASSLFVMPRLAEFMARHPLLQVELYTDDALSDVVGGGFDAGIRLGDVLAADMIAVPIDRGQRRVIVASSDYVRRHGTPRTPADLAEHDCIRFRFPGSGRLEAWQFAEDGKDFSVDVQGRLIFPDDASVAEAVRGGLGLAQRFGQQVERDIADGRLVQVLAPYAATLPGFYIYYPSREHLPAKLRVFIDFLREPLLED